MRMESEDLGASKFSGEGYIDLTLREDGRRVAVPYSLLLFRHAIRNDYNGVGICLLPLFSKISIRKAMCLLRRLQIDEGSREKFIQKTARVNHRALLMGQGGWGI
jgi:hypothetical protein